jgi:hypothetical protein
MPKVEKINSISNKPFLRTDNTGYAALAGIGLTIASAAAKNKSVKKLHKPLAFISAGAALLHLGIILHNRHEWKKKQKDFTA